MKPIKPFVTAAVVSLTLAPLPAFASQADETFMRLVSSVIVGEQTWTVRGHWNDDDDDRGHRYDDDDGGRDDNDDDD